MTSIYFTKTGMIVSTEGVPDLWTGRAEKPIPPASDPSTSSGLLWTEEAVIAGVARFELDPEQPGLDAALALDLDGATLLEDEQALKLFVDRARHLNRIGQAARFHAAGEVHRVAPQVIDVLALADDAGHHRAAVDADAQLHHHLMLHRVLARDVDHAD